MKKRLLSILLIAILTFTFTCAASYADEKSDLQNKLKEQKQGAKDAKQEYNEKKAEEQRLAEKISGIEAQVQEIETQVKGIESELRAVKKDIERNNKKIETVTVDVERLDAEVGTQNSELMSRLRVMYTTSDTSVIEVLLDSEDILDFLSNLDMIQAIHAQDVKMLEELNAKLDEVKQKKAELVTIKETLTQHLREEKQKKEDLAAKEEKLAAKEDELAAAKAEAHADAAAALEDAERMEEASKNIEKKIKELENRGITYGGGKMGWPVNGTVTSEYGWRSHPSTGVSHLHAGLDIAAPTGTPVYAASDGVVVMSSYYGGYGNAVVIDHGSGITTLYGHNSRLASSVGSSVKRGDVIAYVGSTGDSTGPHCHFEVRVNGSPQNPRNWL